jgi:hypothetical protein
MRMRPSLQAVVVGLTAALALGTASTPAQATDPDPTAALNALLSPSIEDPLISLLAAIPMPYRPYAGPICVSGDPQCIVDVIAEMENRLAPEAASCDHDAIFGLAYLRVTQNVKAAADNGYFHDRKWLTQVDAVFADMYFKTMDTWRAGNKSAVPHSWRIALQASDDKAMSGLGDFMLNMNAHINNDFPYVLEKVGLTATDGTSHKPDHNAYNQRLDSLYHPVFDEEAARFDPMFNKFDIGPVDELVVSTIMRGWREMVWRHAEALAATRNIPLLRQAVQKEIEEYAAGQAQFIKLIPIFVKASSPNREAFCAIHHD